MGCSLCFYYLKEQGYKDISLIGLEEAGCWCVAAIGALEGLSRAVVDTKFFESLDDKWYKDSFYVPHILAAGGMETSLRLNPFDKLELLNTSEDSKVADLARKIYASMGKRENIKVLFDAGGWLQAEIYGLQKDV